jgi:hypothetical protein
LPLGLVQYFFAAIASIISLVVIACPLSPSTLAAASMALSLVAFALAAGLALAGFTVLAFAGFLAASGERGFRSKGKAILTSFGRFFRLIGRR